jgi:hypothetical protein
MVPCDTGLKRASVISKLLPGIPWELIRSSDNSADASVITFEFDSGLPWLMIVTASPDSDVSSIAHEVFHLTHRVMQYIRADEFSHEPYAYLYHHLFENILMITHEKSSERVDFCDDSRDLEMIEYLNSEHDLQLKPLNELNKLIMENI